MVISKLTLKQSIIDLGFANNLKGGSLDEASIKTMQSLLDGHPKSFKIGKRNISRYAASLIGFFRGILSEPKSVINKYEKLDNFIKLFVKRFFFSEGKVVNVELFSKLFGTELINERINIKMIKENPDPKMVLKYSIQKRPISDFKSSSNLNKLKKNIAKPNYY